MHFAHSRRTARLLCSIQFPNATISKHVLSFLEAHLQMAESIGRTALFLSKESLRTGRGVVLGRDVDYQDVIAKSASFIHTNFDRPITLRQLSARCGCNSFQVIRAFRRTLGTTPYAFLIHFRLERALELLATGKGAAEVATAVGFFDQSHLIRHCKRRLGKTPRQLMQSGRN